MRGTIENLVSPYPMADSLPGVFRDDDPLLTSFAASLDDLLAPLISVLDNLPAYISAAHAPDDLLEWVASWLGFGIDPGWPEHRRRLLVATAPELLARRGTVEGMRLLVQLVTGCTVTVEDSGGVAANTTN